MRQEGKSHQYHPSPNSKQYEVKHLSLGGRREIYEQALDLKPRIWPTMVKSTRQSPITPVQANTHG